MNSEGRPGDTYPYDELEPPGVHSRLMVMIAVGVLAFVAVAISLLALFYHLMLGGLQPPRPRAFPAPTLETNIEPRTLAAVAPGPAEVRAPKNPVPDEAILQQAMVAVAARGAHAYDPLAPAVASTPPGGAAAGPPPAGAADQASGTSARSARRGAPR